MQPITLKNIPLNPFELQKELTVISESFKLFSSIEAPHQIPDAEKLKALFEKLERILERIGDSPNPDPQEVARFMEMTCAAVAGLERALSDSSCQDLDVLDVLKEKIDQARSWAERIEGTFIQSDNPSDIDWKILKYETLLKKLEKGLRELNSENQSSVEEIADEFLLLGRQDDLSCFLEILTSAFRRENSGRFTQDYLSLTRSALVSFILHLRSRLQNDPDDKTVLDVCRVVFTGVYLEEVCFELVNKFNQMGRGYRKLPVTMDFPTSLLDLYENLAAVPYCAKAPVLDQIGNSLRGRFNFDFDPAVQGNPRHVIYHVTVGGKRVAALGMGNPTQEELRSPASINPEFKGLLRLFSKENKKFLLVSNQDFRSGNSNLSWLVGGDETSRMRATVLDLPKEFAGTFYAIVLSKNSDFYHQRINYEFCNVSEAFIQILFEETLQKGYQYTGNFIPDSVRDRIPNFVKKVRMLLGKIHEKIFCKKYYLSKDERRVFISLFHQYLVKMLLIHLEVDAFTICCKDGIDRGAESNAEFYAVSAIAAGRGDLPQEQQRIAALMFARALMVRKRPPFKDRVERLVELISFSQANQNRLAAFSDASEMSGLDVEGPVC